MHLFDITACTSFGVESATKAELRRMGYGDCPAVDGRLTFKGSLKDVLRCNINLRTADRILIKVAEFGAETFDDLFDGVSAVRWKDYIALGQKITVAAKSVKSKLFALSAIQSLTKKAVAENLKKSYKTAVLEESGAEIKIEVSIKNDIAVLSLDTSGAGLHKRGYRDLVGAAPLKETVAAAMILLSVWNPDRPFVDLFCGSGTLPIEAAMIGQNIAPCVDRTFAINGWKFFDRKLFDEVAEEARDGVKPRELKIMGFDIDENAVSLSLRHARRCGVENSIHFQRQDFKDFSSKAKYGVIVSNPPYGERLMNDRQVRFLYKDLRAKWESLDEWSMGLLTSYYDFEGAFGKKADKNRKLFNANLECHFYQYLGARPPKKQ